MTLGRPSWWFIALLAGLAVACWIIGARAEGVTDCGPGFLTIEPDSYITPTITVDVIPRRGGHAWQRIAAFPSESRCQETLRLVREVVAQIPTAVIVSITPLNCVARPYEK